MDLTHEYTADVEHRFKYTVWVIIVFFIIVLARLYYLQILKGEYYRFFSTENSIKERTIPAVRGMIFDRRGQILVESRPSFDIVIIPQYVVNSQKVFHTLARYLNISLEDLEEKWKTRTGLAPYQPIVIKKDVSRDEVSAILARKGPWYDERDQDDFRGVEAAVRYKRIYTDGALAPHLLGYVREIDAQRLAQYRKLYPDRYFIGDQVGMRGVEETWDLALRGYDGYEQRIVNAVGREIDYEGIADQLEHKSAIPGDSLVLTLDKDVQEVAKSMFGEKKGAAVMVDVNNGGIIAMYSSPSYDLNILASPEGSNYWLEIAQDPRNYLINRAIQGGYPPGSTYKVVTAIAALSEDVIKPDETVICGGALVYGGRPFHCWRKGGHGAISLHRAIVQSCDVYFYRMGLRLGVDRLAKYAKLLGLGQKTGVPLSNERSGLIPTSEWKLKRFGVPWQGGETLSISVGQGYDVLTPIQNAFVAAYIANKGKYLMPHIVRAAYNPKGRPVYEWSPKELSKDEQIPISKDVIKLVRDAMVGVVAEPGGTAHRLSTYELKMGGKTGTAQVMQLDSGVACYGEKCRDHAWFIGFAPAENPEVAAAVVVEHGGFGASAAAPIVGAMLQKYYDIEEESKQSATGNKSLDTTH